MPLTCTVCEDILKVYGVQLRKSLFSGKTMEVQIKPSQAELQEENRRLRRLQLMVSMVMSVISQSNLPVEEASELAASARRAALHLFPGKELAYDLIYKPRLQRLMAEKYRIH